MSRITELCQELVGAFSPNWVLVMSYWHHHGFRVWSKRIKRSMDLSQIWINKIRQG